jgi:hypothetical protein
VTGKKAKNTGNTRLTKREEKFADQSTGTCTNVANMCIQMIVASNRHCGTASRPASGASRVSERIEYARDAQHPQLARYEAGRAKLSAQTIAGKGLAATATMRNSGKKTRRRCALRIFRPKFALPAAGENAMAKTRLTTTNRDSG